MLLGFKNTVLLPVIAALTFYIRVNYLYTYIYVIATSIIKIISYIFGPWKGPIASFHDFFSGTIYRKTKVW